MSAWLCTDEHIFEIAAFYLKNCYVPPFEMTLETLATILYKENVASLDARYPNDEPLPKLIVPNDYEAVVTNHTHMAKLVNCYAYQSCEHEGWETSASRTSVCDIILDFVTIVDAEYDAAPWGFDREEYIAKFK